MSIGIANKRGTKRGLRREKGEWSGHSGKEDIDCGGLEDGVGWCDEKQKKEPFGGH